MAKYLMGERTYDHLSLPDFEMGRLLGILFVSLSCTVFELTSLSQKEDLIVPKAREQYSIERKQDFWTRLSSWMRSSGRALDKRFNFKPA